MFAEQRQEKIMHLLEEYGQVDVSSLTSILSASEATIRRDLEKLERAGLLHRTHGGAILSENSSPILQAITKKNTPLDEEIDSIGKTASRLLSPGQVIAIGSGPLGLSLARNLDNSLQCTIITNDTAIMTELLNRQQTNVIMIGGLAHQTDQGIFTSGESTLRMLEEFNVEKAFLSIDGISETAGLTTRDFEYALIWKKIKSIATETVILALPDAFDKRELVRLAPIGDVQRYVSTGSLPDPYKQYFFKHSIPVHMSFDL